MLDQAGGTQVPVIRDRILVHIAIEATDLRLPLEATATEVILVADIAVIERETITAARGIIIDLNGDLDYEVGREVLRQGDTIIIAESAVVGAHMVAMEAAVVVGVLTVHHPDEIHPLLAFLLVGKNRIALMRPKRRLQNQARTNSVAMSDQAVQSLLQRHNPHQALHVPQRNRLLPARLYR
jgi:hypothetical protein